MPVCVEITNVSSIPSVDGNGGQLTIVTQTPIESCPGYILYTQTEIAGGASLQPFIMDFQPDIFEGALFILFGALAIGFSGGMLLNVVRKGRRF